MHAQLIEGSTTPQRRPDTDCIVTDELIPALETEPGYAGALNLPDQANGARLTIVIFQTEAQARRALGQYAPRFLSLGRRLIAASAPHRH
jgi:hypothetical protein